MRALRQVVNREGRRGHVCDERFCSRCNGYHTKERGCFIEPLPPSENESEYRLIIFDFESSQDHPCDPNPFTLQHEVCFTFLLLCFVCKQQVNFIAASVVCTKCIRDDTWREPLREECEICGTDRTFTWSHASFTRTPVDVSKTTESPLTDFVDWLLHHFLDKPHENVVLSHYGVKFKI